MKEKTSIEKLEDKIRENWKTIETSTEHTQINDPNNEKVVKRIAKLDEEMAKKMAKGKSNPSIIKKYNKFQEKHGELQK